MRIQMNRPKLCEHCDNSRKWSTWIFIERIIRIADKVQQSILSHKRTHIEKWWTLRRLFRDRCVVIALWYIFFSFRSSAMGTALSLYIGCVAVYREIHIHLKRNPMFNMYSCIGIMSEFHFSLPFIPLKTICVFSKYTLRCPMKNGPFTRNHWREHTHRERVREREEKNKHVFLNGITNFHQTNKMR